VAVEAAIETSRRRGERVFVVGGVVRDALMGRSVGEHDLDIVVEGEGISFARGLAEILGGGIRVHEPFLTAKLTAPFSEALSYKARLGSLSSLDDGVLLDEVDVATARQEIYERPGALPVVKPAKIEFDLWRRDFSSNAIALPLESYKLFRMGSLEREGLSRFVIDPCGGIGDIRSGVLRVLHPLSFIDDPTRLFRAVRYLVRLGFNFESATLAGFLEAIKSGVLRSLSARRVWNEVLVVFDEEHPGDILQEFFQRGLFVGLEVISAEDPAWFFEALERLEVLRGIIGEGDFCEAGKILLIANLLRVGREDTARAVHEGNKVLQRAAGVLVGDVSPDALKTVSDLSAAYCIHCTEELRTRLQMGVVGRATGPE
jgi:tRNA nucleotidyltransferase (CCA-adding enzyme)